MRRASRLAAIVAVLVAFYAAVAVWFTWPLAAHLRTHLPDTWFGCRVDLLVTGWILAHDSRALLSNPLLVGEANIYHPTPHSLFYGESSLGSVPLFLPTFTLTGDPVLSLNLLFLAATALTLASMHFLAWRWTGSHVAAFVAAWMVATSRWFFWWTPSAPLYAVLFCFPLILLVAAEPAVVRGRVVQLVPLLVLQCLTTPYVAFGVLLPLGALTLWRLARPATRPGGVQLLVSLAVAGLLLAPVYAGYAVVRLANPDLAQQSYWARSLEALAVWLPWGILDRDRPTGVPLAAIALTVIGAGVVLARSRAGSVSPLRARWLYAGYWAVAGVFLSFSPQARWGNAVVWMPQALVWGMPFLENIRVPHRLGVAALFGIASLCGLAIAELRRALDRRCTTARAASLAGLGVAALAAWLMYFDYARGLPMRMPPGFIRIEPVYPLAGPLPALYPLRPAPDLSSPLLGLLAREEGALVELPIGAGAVGSSLDHTHAMFRSIVHHRPILNGYLSYWPKEYPRRMALVRRLPEPAAIEELVQSTGLRFVLVHTAALRENDRVAWLAEANAPRDDLRLFARDGDDLLFEVGPDGEPPSRPVS